MGNYIYHANFGGHHVHFGKMIYANFGLTLVDDTHIYVGDNTMFGPNVVVATAGHPILPELREKGINIIHPSISGRIVTKDLPSNVIAIGNPCKVIREVNDQDKEYYFKNRKIGEDFKEYK